MRNFYYGNFESKIREKISETVQKGKFLKFEYPLVPDNISEILSGISKSKSESACRWFATIFKKKFDTTIGSNPKS